MKEQATNGMPSLDGACMCRGSFCIHGDTSSVTPCCWQSPMYEDSSNLSYRRETWTCILTRTRTSTSQVHVVCMWSACGLHGGAPSSSPVTTHLPSSQSPSANGKSCSLCLCDPTCIARAQRQTGPHLISTTFHSKSPN